MDLNYKAGLMFVTALIEIRKKGNICNYPFGYLIRAWLGFKEKNEVLKELEIIISAGGFTLERIISWIPRTNYPEWVPLPSDAVLENMDGNSGPEPVGIWVSLPNQEYEDEENLNEEDIASFVKDPGLRDLIIANRRQKALKHEKSQTEGNPAVFSDIRLNNVYLNFIQKYPELKFVEFPDDAVLDITPEIFVIKLLCYDPSMKNYKPGGRRECFWISSKNGEYSRELLEVELVSLFPFRTRRW